MKRLSNAILKPIKPHLGPYNISEGKLNYKKSIKHLFVCEKASKND